MLRRFLTLLAIALLCIGLLPITAGVALAHGGDCSMPRDYDSSQLFGLGNSSLNTSRSGAKSTIFIDTTINGFRECADPFLGDNNENGVFAFVAMHPREPYSNCSDGDGIECGIRVGIAQCTDDLNTTLCDNQPGDGGPQKVYAEIYGCSGTTPYRQYLGAPSGSEIDVAIYKTDSDEWAISYDGSIKTTWDQDTTPQMACWKNANLEAGWYGLYWDNADSLGTWGGIPTGHVDARYGIENQGWFSPGWSTGNCIFGNDAGEDCTKVSPDWLYFETG